ncbi:LysM peptidoglycan-binding domain-containing protein [Photobacterium rosenbergii]|uniref:LysM peptidoglycan-binding domain-containing protein n=1 Tax=Photobacterium rosenbergii TaxID=294936 RepID=UPI001C99A1FC|nr:LysM domain-containing protein [Photobacterium rosenbergii]MBY5948948.1 LysM peptidoglycan-binding domain-containing protein [Photobacterium rosenbergii]
MAILKTVIGRWVFGVVFAAMGVANHAQASELYVIDDAPSVYTVKKGDTLWDIAGHYLASPWRWPELWQSNRATVADPHWIYPGDQLYLYWVDGQPRLQRKPRQHLSPRAIVSPKPVTTLLAQLLLPYLAEDKLLANKDIPHLPHVIGDSRAQGYIPRGETIWVDKPLIKGDKWGIFRPHQQLQRELESGESSKVSTLKEVARGEVIAVTETTSAVLLTDARKEVKPNDVLLPAPLPPSKAALSFIPSPYLEPINTKVVAGLGGMAYIATHEVVVLDRGHLDGLAAGHVFHILRPGATYMGNKGAYEYGKPESPIMSSSLTLSQSHQLKDIPIGEVMVIRPYDYFSLAVVTKATEPFRTGVQLVPPRIG